LEKKKEKGKRGGGCTASGYGEIHKRKDTTTIIVCLDKSRNAIRRKVKGEDGNQTIGGGNNATLIFITSRGEMITWHHRGRRRL
jgi:hypothetical protein